MGRQRGVVHLSGQFGDVQLSIDQGVGRAKLSTPVSKDRIMRDPEYDLTRKSMSEFTAAGRAATTLMETLGENASSFGERFLRSRLQRLLRRVVTLGPGSNGQRSLEVVANKHMFKEVDLNTRDRLHSRLKVPYTLTVNGDRNTATLDVPQFFTQNLLKAPSGATHFQLTLSAGVLSDWTYQGIDDGYQPVNPDLDGVMARAQSLVMPAVNYTILPMQLVAALPGLPVLPATAGLAVSVAIEFFKVVNNQPDLMASGNALAIKGMY